MTDLALLKVSLTKHNAHKLAHLLKRYPASQILSKLAEVHIDGAQARKTLSVLGGGKVPDVWARAKELGGSAIDALILVAIVFSHHETIAAMANASARTPFSGRIERGVQLSGKAYTNFVRVVDQLGYAKVLNRGGVTFNVRPMFKIPGLGPLVADLLTLKLRTARWDGSSSVGREAVALDVHKVFGISARQLDHWLAKDEQPSSVGADLLAKDEEFFHDEDEGGPSTPFEFRAGHAERSVEPISRSAPAKTKAAQLHNDIQNKLYAHLSEKLSERNVGTEIDTGNGTTVDVATRYNGETTFYEIKTSASVRSSIRQAIPQLLEYAYWPDLMRANRLVIVSHLPITRSAETYIGYLRRKFGIPLLYLQFDLTKNILVGNM
jgi:hypothetical protein